MSEATPTIDGPAPAVVKREIEASLDAYVKEWKAGIGAKVEQYEADKNKAKPSSAFAGDAEFKEDDHPRGEGGKFASNGSAPVHVVTTQDARSGKAKVLSVYASKNAAMEHQASMLKSQYAKLAGNYDITEQGYPEAYQNASHALKALQFYDQEFASRQSSPIYGKSVDPKDVHVVAESKGDGGVHVHGVHDNMRDAIAHATQISRAAWAENGETRGEITESEWDKAQNDFNANRPKSQHVTREEMESNSNEDFEKFLADRHPFDELLPYPGLSKANNHLADSNYFDGEAKGNGVVRVSRHTVIGAPDSEKSSAQNNPESGAWLDRMGALLR